MSFFRTALSFALFFAFPAALLTAAAQGADTASKTQNGQNSPQFNVQNQIEGKIVDLHRKTVEGAKRSLRKARPARRRRVDGQPRQARRNQGPQASQRRRDQGQRSAGPVLRRNHRARRSRDGQRQDGPDRSLFARREGRDYGHPIHGNAGHGSQRPDDGGSRHNAPRGSRDGKEWPEGMDRFRARTRTSRT